MSNEQKKIVWIASYPKSGNTWFRAFLANILSETEGPVSINDLQTAPIASSRSLFDNYSGTSSSDLTLHETMELRPEIYKQLASESEKTIFQKVHDAYTYTRSGAAIFPKEVTRAVIYILRNPLDIVISYAYHMGKPIDEVIGIMNNEHHAMCDRPNMLYSQLMQPLSDWSGHVKSWVDESGLPVFVMRYEDMLSDTFTLFKRALAFVGIEAGDAEIKAGISASSYSVLSGMEEKDGFREKPLGMKKFFRKGEANAWRNELNKKSAEALILKHKDVMERFGYL